jgi:hypothetical protein
MGLSQATAADGAEEGAGWVMAAFMYVSMRFRKNSGTSTLDAAGINFYAKHGAKLDECASNLQNMIHGSTRQAG